MYTAAGHAGQTESEIIVAFLDAMRACGVNIDTASNGGGHPIMDGKIHRADSAEPKGKGKKHVWYVGHLDEPASGAFGDYKQGISETWTGGRAIKEMTAAERAAIKKRLDEARAAREAHAKAMAERAAEVAAQMLDKAASERATAEHPYLAKKGLPAFPGARVLSKSFRYTIDPEDGQRTAHKGTLLIPMFHDIEGKATLIGAQMIANDGRKLFLKGTPKASAFHPVGKMQADDADIFLAEGYATAARIHEATGCRAIAAFDAGNLKPVALAVRKKWPRARLIIMADNDRFTTQPVDNPGVTAAREAAQAIGGAPVIIPQFERGEDDATDFDDLAQLRGTGAICAAIDAVLNPAPPEQDYPPHYDEAPPYDGGDYVAPMDPHGEFDFSDIAAQQLESFGEPHFRCLGVDGLTFYYQAFTYAEIVSFTASAHKIENLMTLAPLQWWEANFPAKKEGVDIKAAVNACISASQRKGKFRAERVRGRGIYADRDRLIAHLGDRLIVNGQTMALHKMKDRYIYTLGDEITIPAAPPLTNSEARQLVDLAESLPWKEPEMARFYAGWIVIAAICGALKWRPTLWITGEPGSGKSYLINNVAREILGEMAIFINGGTTEAGIRQTLEIDALPVLFDESESKDDRARDRLALVFELMRSSVSEGGAEIVKGSAGGKSKRFSIRSCFAFASVKCGLSQTADISRVLRLELRALDKNAPIECHEAQRETRAEFREKLNQMIDSQFGPRLFARTLAMAPTILHNAKVLSDAIAVRIGDTRRGDVIGPTLAGWISLYSDVKLTADEAREKIEQSSWLGQALSRNLTARDHEQAFAHLMHALVRLDHSTRSVGELVQFVVNADHLENTKEAEDGLRRHGIVIRKRKAPDESNLIILHPDHAPLKGLFAGTQWADDPVGTLRGFPGSYETRNPVRWAGDRKRGVVIDFDAAQNDE